MKFHTALPLAAVALTLTMAAAQANPAASTQAPELAKPTISFAEAVEIATNSAEGDLHMMELAYPFDEPAYLAELESDTSFSDLVIDGATGEVLFSSVETAASPELMDKMIAADIEFEDMLKEFDLANLRPGDDVPFELMMAVSEMDDDDIEDLLDEIKAHECEDEIDLEDEDDVTLD